MSNASNATTNEGTDWGATAEDPVLLSQRCKHDLHSAMKRLPMNI